MSLTSSPLGDVLLFCILGVIAVHASKLYASRRLLLLDPLFAFWGGVFVVNIGQAISHGKTLIEWHGENVFVLTMFWSLVGFISVILGYESRWGVTLANRAPECPGQLSPFKFSAAGFVIIGLGLIGYYFMFDSAGSVKEWLSVGRGATDYDNVSGYLLQLADLVPIGVIILLFHISFHPISCVKRRFVWCLAGLMWLWFLYLGTRYRTIGFTIAMLACYYLPRRKNPPLAVIIPVFLSLFILTNFQAYYRDHFTDLSFNLDKIDPKEACEKVLPGFLLPAEHVEKKEPTSYLELNCIMAVIKFVPDRVPYNYGYGHLEIFTRFIPREIWPDKIYPHMESYQGVLREGELSSAYVRDRDLLMGPAFCFVGHWYYILGGIGIIAGGLLTGVLFRTIRQIYDRSPNNEGNCVLYSSLLVIGFNEAVSTPFYWLTNLPLAIGPMLVFLYLSRVPSRRVASESHPIRPEQNPRTKLDFQIGIKSVESQS